MGTVRVGAPAIPVVVAQVAARQVTAPAAPAAPAAPPPAPADDFADPVKTKRWGEDYGVIPRTFEQDVDRGVQREVLNQMRAFLPKTSETYRALVKLSTSDGFISQSPETQRALLAAVVSAPGDAAAHQQVFALAQSKGFNGLNDATRAKVATVFADSSIAAPERAELAAFLDKPSLAKLDPKVRNALVGAAAKNPVDLELRDKLAALTRSSSFTSLSTDVQARFLHAVEHQSDVVLMEDQELKQAALFELLDSPDFKQLDSGSQGRWMKALADGDGAVRDTAFERLAETKGDPEWMARSSKALDRPGQVDTVRYPLPDSSSKPPTVTKTKEREAAVFFRASGQGIDPKPRKVDAYDVTVDGRTIKVYLPRPPPKGSPTIDAIAQGLADLPKGIREHIDQVILEPTMRNFMQAASANESRPNRVFIGPEGPKGGADLAGMLSHEAGHLVHSDEWDKPGKPLEAWEAAIASDEHAVSAYATSNVREDAAETIAYYYQVKGTPAEADFKRDMPARYEALKKLLGEK